MWFTFRIKASEPAGRGRSPGRPGRGRGFTLVELLVSMAIFTAILGLCIGAFTQATGIWRRSLANVKAFQSARIAYDLLSRNLAQATLNTHLDYVDSANRFAGDPGYSPPPARYARRSDLQFVCTPAGGTNAPGTAGSGTAVFFQVPTGFEGTTSDYRGLPQLLNTCGYFIQFGDDPSRPGFVPPIPKYRYRLMQMMVPTQLDTIYVKAPAWDWFNSSSARTNSWPVADNIIALLLRPEFPSSAGTTQTVYGYDSRSNERSKPQPPTANQLPPVIHVTMVALDEASALRIDAGAEEPALIRSSLADKFTDISKFDADLKGLETELASHNLGYRVFSGAVRIGESKWSKE